MSSFKRAPVTGGVSGHNVLSSLRKTQVTIAKPVLPAELIATILDYLPIPDLLHFARTSRRMREMVYDDTRWITKLRSMDLWDENEARSRFEEATRKRLEAQRAKQAEESKRTGIGLHGGANGVAVGGAPPNIAVTLFDAGMEVERQKKEAGQMARGESLEDGFDNLNLTPTSPHSTSKMLDPNSALNVLSRVRSIRGQARQEFGKVYGALAPYYFDLARSNSHTDPILFRAFQEPEHQAQMLSQLKVFAKCDTAQGWSDREYKLESMMGLFENAVLREFERGYQANDIDGRMHRYANVLVTLSGGAAGVDYFIHNHPLMLDKDQIGDPTECLRDLEPSGVSLEPLHTAFQNLATTINELGSVVDRVFPPTIDVLLPFIERVSEDILSDYVNTLFGEAHNKGSEQYLTAVSGVFSQSLRLAQTIQPTKASNSNFKAEVQRIIGQCFEPHIDLYLQEELEFFKRKSEAQVEAWEKQLSEQEKSTESYLMSNVSRQAAKRDFLTSFKKVVMMPVNVLPSFGGSATKSTTSLPATNGETLEPSSRAMTPVPGERSPSPRLEAPTNELAAKAAVMNSRLEGIRSLFSIEVALNLVHAAKTSLERVALFVRLGGQSGEEAREQCESIFINLLQILSSRHIRPGFDKAVNHLSTYNPREVAEHSEKGVEPLVTFLELVNVGDLIQQMVDVFYVQELVLSKLADGDDFLSPAVKEKKRFEQMLDERVAAGLNKGIDVLMDEVEYICGSTQLPTDYNPEAASDGTMQPFEIGPTNTAKQVVDMVSSHTGMLVGSTDKNMLDVFNQEVGLRLFAALCKHVKRQRISVDGAVRLISDMNIYYSYITTLKNKTMTQYFSALRELSQIYLISSSHAKEIATIIADTDRYYGIFRAEEVYEFAQRRADWFVVKRAVEKAMYGVGCAVM